MQNTQTNCLELKGPNLHFVVGVLTAQDLLALVEEGLLEEASYKHAKSSPCAAAHVSL